MRAHHLQIGTAIAISLLVGACEDTPARSDPAAPDIPDALSPVSSAAGARTFHFKDRGRQAQLSFFVEQPDGALIGEVQVSRSGTKSDQQTFLFYSLQRCDFTTFECLEVEFGSGLIPNRDVAFGQGEVSLRTNTSVSANPAFDRVGSGGAITLHWTRTSAFTQDFHTHSRTQFGGALIEHSRFAGTFSSALAEGTVLGVAVDAGNSGASVGTVRSGLLVIQKAP